MIRPARAGEEDAILSFLKPHAHSSMFLMSNLLAHGLFDRDAPHGSTYLVTEDDDQISGVLGLTNNGYLMVQCPSADMAVWEAFADWLIGKKIAGATGVVDQVNALTAVLGLPENVYNMVRDEPFYHLSLDQMTAPECHVRPVRGDDLDFLTDWIKSYVVETGIEPDVPATHDVARARAVQALKEDNVRLLCKDGAVVAMAGINARAGDTVQIGQVYTPPEHRGKGYAGKAVANLLRDVAPDGIKETVLFAASEQAARAYERIGYVHKGYYKMALLSERQIYRGRT